MKETKQKSGAGYDCVGVGCGALIINDKNETLLLKRGLNLKNTTGLWSKPGGQVEFGEKVEDAVKREINEELGVDIDITKFLGFSEGIMVGEKQHWISFNYLVKIKNGEPKNMEPEKHDEIKWFSLDNLPENITPYTIEPINEYLKINKKI